MAELAYLYGWSPKQVLEEVYPSNVFVYLKAGRRNKVSDYLMLLSITHNPHTKNSKTLFNNLREELVALRDREDDTLDREALMKLKKIINKK